MQKETVAMNICRFVRFIFRATFPLVSLFSNLCVFLFQTNLLCSAEAFIERLHNWCHIHVSGQERA